jgi:hypothetical protein
MSDTFRIKPLVWKTWEDDNSVQEAWNELVSVTVEDNGCWYLYRQWRFDWFVNAGTCDTVEDAKACAESAYRDLLMAALEPV